MPKRPRSHQLESRSEAQFASAIPDSWVYRPKAKDYGIDGEVEIFDSAGSTTGNVFLVQLKATDGKRSTSLSIWFSNDTAQYYASLALPVLVVRYVSAKKKLYARWFHSLDFYYGSRAKKGVTFRFDDSHEWNTTHSGHPSN